jgi:hypothetical protein
VVGYWIRATGDQEREETSFREGDERKQMKDQLKVSNNKSKFVKYLV